MIDRFFDALEIEAETDALAADYLEAFFTAYDAVNVSKTRCALAMGEMRGPRTHEEWRAVFEECADWPLWPWPEAS